MTNSTIGETRLVGEHGAVALPADLRRRFGIEEGTAVVAEAREDGILIRPARIYTAEQKASFVLNSATDAEDYAEACRFVRDEMGLDPDVVDHRKPGES